MTASDALGTRLDQGVRVGPALQHGQVRRTDVPGQRRHGHELADQVLDADLVLGAGLGEAVTRPDPPVQRGTLGAGQLQWLQAGGVEQGQAGQGVGVDAVGLGVPGQEAAQVGGLGRASPGARRGPGPRRTRRWAARPAPSAPPPPPTSCLPGSRPGPRSQPRSGLRPWATPCAWPRDCPRRREPARCGRWRCPGRCRPGGGGSSRLLRWCRSHRLARRGDALGHGPKESRPTDGSHSCAANGSDLTGSSHFPHPGHPWPGRVWQSVERGQTLTGLPQTHFQRHPPDQPGCTCNLGTSAKWWIHRAGVPYMTQSELVTREHARACRGVTSSRGRRRRGPATPPWPTGRSPVR